MTTKKKKPLNNRERQRRFRERRRAETAALRTENLQLREQIERLAQKWRAEPMREHVP